MSGLKQTSNDDKTEFIELVLPKHLLLNYALLAHEQDITLNQWFMKAVLSYIEGLDDVITNNDK